MTNRQDAFKLKLEQTLCDLDFAKGAQVKIEDGHLWIQHKPTRPWMQANRIPPDLLDSAVAFVHDYMNDALS